MDCEGKGELFDATWEARASSQAVKEAKRVCQGCPVILDCLRDHLGEPDGVWGGTTGRERRKLVRRRGTRTVGREDREATA